MSSALYFNIFVSGSCNPTKVFDCLFEQNSKLLRQVIIMYVNGNKRSFHVIHYRVSHKMFKRMPTEVVTSSYLLITKQVIQVKLLLRERKNRSMTQQGQFGEKATAMNKANSPIKPLSSTGYRPNLVIKTHRSQKIWWSICVLFKLVRDLNFKSS